jgi:L-lactate dehydrogenase complex protein LldF
MDGPEEFYVVLLDNGRTKVLADREKRESLYCIRCGACLNHCPVYRKIGGHSFPWVYSGPIGAILTPQFLGVNHEPALPFASSLCGACAEVCPVKIDIPRILLELRSDVKKAEQREGSGVLERLAFRAFAWVMRHPRIYEMAGMAAASLAPSADGGGWIRRAPGAIKLPPIDAWLSQRDLPPPAPKSFRQMWRER